MNTDYRKLVHSAMEEKKRFMKDFFTELLKSDRKRRIGMFEELISGIAKVTDDREYIEMCKLSMELILTMDKNVAGEVINTRLEAQFELPEAEKVIDSRNLMRAINEMPEKDIILALIEAN